MSFKFETSFTEKEIEGFTIVCDKCKSTDVVVNDSIACGSTFTRFYGSMDIICNNCREVEEIFSLD